MSSSGDVNKKFPLVGIYSVMNQTKLRKNYVACKDSAPSDELPSAQKPCNKKKGRHKGNAYGTNYQHSYDMGFTPRYAFNLPPHTRIHPSSQRLFQTTDTSLCHYPVPLSIPVQHVSLPVYSPLLQAGTTSAPPVERVFQINQISEHKIPRMFQTFKHNNDVEQDYTSLPPVNGYLNSKQVNDDDSTSKRRFSDPGLAQISSDECSGSRSSESSNSSLQDLQMPYSYGLIEQVNELRENNSDLTKDLHEMKLELQSLKLLSASWRPYSENLQPGKLSDSIVEIRDAIKVNEEAMMTKMTNLFEKNLSLCNEMHRQLEEKINEKVNERLGKLEEKIRIVSESVSKSSQNELPAGEEVAVAGDVFLIQQLVDSEREKLSLRKELQEAIDSRKKAEAHTLKLERLIRVPYKKINGVSLESCMMEEKPPTIRPISSSIEQNQFIIANSINSHKNKQQKRNLGSKKIESDAKENGTGNEDEGGPTSSEATSIAPQVTITGPVTDL